MPEPFRLYCMGGDTGAGRSSQDRCAASVLAVDNGEQVASWLANAEARDFAQQLMMLGTFFGGRRGQAYLCCEINNHGLATLEVLRSLGYWNLYCKQEWNSVDRKFIPQVGFNTNVKSRPILISRMRSVLQDGSIDIRDESVLEEASTFVMTDAGKEEHVEGARDDALFAYMLALEARFMAMETTPASEIAPQADNKDRWVWERTREIIRERQVARYVEMEDDY